MRAQTTTHAARPGRVAALLLLLALAVPNPARAQARPPLDALGDAFPHGAPPMPVCNAPRDGVAACLAGRQCLCGHERGGSVTGRTDGWRWDCGTLRPACDAAPARVPPADLPAGTQSYGAQSYGDVPYGNMPYADGLPFRAPFRPGR